MTGIEHKCLHCEAMLPRDKAFCKPFWQTLGSPERFMVYRSLVDNGIGSRDHAAVLAAIVEGKNDE